MASYLGMTNLVDFSVGLRPNGAFPLDPRSMFGSYDAAVAAAATAAVTGTEEAKKTRYYIGQTLTVFENDVVASYQIQADKTLKAIGASVVGDNKSIVVGENDVLSLKNFGSKYYAYKPADNILAAGEYTYPDTMPEGVDGAYVNVADVWYVYTEGAWTVTDVVPSNVEKHVETEGWKAGLEPRVIQTAQGYELAWYEPSTTTVEGVAAALAAVQGSVEAIDEKVDNTRTDLEKQIDDEETRALAAESALDAKIKTNSDAIGVLNGDASTEGSVKNSISKELAALLNNDTAINSIQALVDWADEHAEDYLELQNNVTANKNALDELKAIVGELPEGIQATDVIGYIQELVAAEETRALAAEQGLQNSINQINTTVGNLGTAASKNVEYFATAEQGAKADTAVQSVVASETNNGAIVVDGDEVIAYTLPNATVSNLGGVKPDGMSLTTNDQGVISVSAVDHSKVTGLGDQLNATQEAAVEAAAQDAADKYIPTESIAGSTNLAETPEAASDGKVISEKVLLDALTWKTTM